ncbi:hypothetical protein BLNAU_6713 [Blattamonas nauphoetae]|uniref:Uncharacterized protein n=1 Tax=Blattamonas nauphoetae TaxID=2049346 RepID=A0ABQ9Y3B3_9EUKA|nr:hypothetical protein BLNAU_6713 [Blattamonas nauphoetae]
MDERERLIIRLTEALKTQNSRVEHLQTELRNKPAIDSKFIEKLTKQNSLLLQQLHQYASTNPSPPSSPQETTHAQNQSTKKTDKKVQFILPSSPQPDPVQQSVVSAKRVQPDPMLSRQAYVSPLTQHSPSVHKSGVSSSPNRLPLFGSAKSKENPIFTPPPSRIGSKTQTHRNSLDLLTDYDDSESETGSDAFSRENEGTSFVLLPSPKVGNRPQKTEGRSRKLLRLSENRRLSEIEAEDTLEELGQLEPQPKKKKGKGTGRKDKENVQLPKWFNQGRETRTMKRVNEDREREREQEARRLMEEEDTLARGLAAQMEREETERRERARLEREHLEDMERFEMSTEDTRGLILRDESMRRERERRKMEETMREMAERGLMKKEDDEARILNNFWMVEEERRRVEREKEEHRKELERQRDEEARLLKAERERIMQEQERLRREEAERLKKLQEEEERQREIERQIRESKEKLREEEERLLNERKRLEAEVEAAKAEQEREKQRELERIREMERKAQLEQQKKEDEQKRKELEALRLIDEQLRLQNEAIEQENRLKREAEERRAMEERKRLEQLRGMENEDWEAKLRRVEEIERLATQREKEERERREQALREQLIREEKRREQEAIEIEQARWRNEERLRIESEIRKQHETEQANHPITKELHQSRKKRQKKKEKERTKQLNAFIRSFTASIPSDPQVLSSRALRPLSRRSLYSQRLLNFVPPHHILTPHIQLHTSMEPHSALQVMEDSVSVDVQPTIVQSEHTDIQRMDKQPHSETVPRIIELPDSQPLEEHNWSPPRRPSSVLSPHTIPISAVSTPINTQSDSPPSPRYPYQHVPSKAKNTPSYVAARPPPISISRQDQTTATSSEAFLPTPFTSPSVLITPATPALNTKMPIPSPLPNSISVVAESPLPHNTPLPWYVGLKKTVSVGVGNDAVSEQRTTPDTPHTRSAQHPSTFTSPMSNPASPEDEFTPLHHTALPPSDGSASRQLKTAQLTRATQTPTPSPSRQIGENQDEAETPRNSDEIKQKHHSSGSSKKRQRTSPKKEKHVSRKDKAEHQSHRRSTISLVSEHDTDSGLPSFSSPSPQPALLPSLKPPKSTFSSASSRPPSLQHVKTLASLSSTAPAQTEADYEQEWNEYFLRQEQKMQMKREREERLARAGVVELFTDDSPDSPQPERIMKRKRPYPTDSTPTIFHKTIWPSQKRRTVFDRIRDNANRALRAIQRAREKTEREEKGIAVDDEEQSESSSAMFDFNPTYRHYSRPIDEEHEERRRFWKRNERELEKRRHQEANQQKARRKRRGRLIYDEDSSSDVLTEQREDRHEQKEERNAHKSVKMKSKQIKSTNRKRSEEKQTDGLAEAIQDVWTSDNENLLLEVTEHLAKDEMTTKDQEKGKTRREEEEEEEEIMSRPTEIPAQIEMDLSESSSDVAETVSSDSSDAPTHAPVLPTPKPRPKPKRKRLQPNIVDSEKRHRQARQLPQQKKTPSPKKKAASPTKKPTPKKKVTTMMGKKRLAEAPHIPSPELMPPPRGVIHQAVQKLPPASLTRAQSSFDYPVTPFAQGSRASAQKENSAPLGTNQMKIQSVNAFRNEQKGRGMIQKGQPKGKEKENRVSSF